MQVFLHNSRLGVTGSLPQLDPPPQGPGRRRQCQGRSSCELDVINGQVSKFPELFLCLLGPHGLWESVHHVLVGLPGVPPDLDKHGKEFDNGVVIVAGVILVDSWNCQIDDCQG